MQRKISVADLRVGMYIARFETDWLNHPFWRKSFAVADEATLERVCDSGIEMIWIDTERGIDVEMPDPREALAVATPALVSEARVAAPLAARPESIAQAMQRAQRLCESAREEVRSMFKDLRMGRAINVESVGPLVEEIADAVRGNAAALLSVARLKSHDDYTYLHSVAVCGLMVALARELGLDDSQTRAAGLAGMMHDVGKALMPPDVLNKPGKLTDDEYTVMKTHSRVGHDLLVKAGNAEAVALEVVLHHHEKIDGSGYPDRLSGDAISLWARMGAVCDVYDALTSNRPYKSGWDPALSVKRMASWKGHFDERVLRAFVKGVGIYPVGSLVRLRSQKLAVVLEPGKSSLIKPTVKIFFSARSKEPVAVSVVDLESARVDDAIVGPEDPDDWGFTHLVELWTPP